MLQLHKKRPKDKKMKLALSSAISKIDEFAKNVLGIPTTELMDRSGRAVENTVRSYVKKGNTVVILAGKGNNGGDGYAAAVRLLDDFSVKVFDVFGEGQRTEEGRHFLELFKSLGGVVETLLLTEEQKREIKNASCIVDAVFGTGFHGEIPECVRELATVVSESVSAVKIAVDVPMGVNADDGSVDVTAPTMHATVELSFIKPGIVSYPARSVVGQIFYDDLGLDIAEILKNFDFKYHLTNEETAARMLPRRKSDSNKGSFGKALIITGSESYRGAARLSLEAALRGGVGYSTYLGCDTLVSELAAALPEAIYKNADLSTAEGRELAYKAASTHTAVLFGSGSGNTDATFQICERLLSEEGCPLLLDADALNALSSKEGALALIKNAKRPVILTPHPLEFARLTGHDVATVQRKRLAAAVRFAAENRCVLVLKGAGTIVTDGKEVYINESGSSALAKAGSGDVLAGFITALSAQGIPPLSAAVLGVYYHGAAGDTLAKEYSTYGVIPSDLPRQIARELAKAEKTK